MNIMSFKLKIIGKITWDRSLEALFNQFDNVVFSSSRKGVPTKTCNHLFGGQMGSIQDYSTTSSFSYLCLLVSVLNLPVSLRVTCARLSGFRLPHIYLPEMKKIHSVLYIKFS